MYAPRDALAKDVDCDIAVIGGGFTGTSTAYHMAKRFPHKRIVLCEARELANGASGRNGGLALNWIHGVPMHDLALARRIYDTTKAAIDSIEARIREHGLDVPWKRESFLEIFTNVHRAEIAAREVERLNAAGVPLRFLSREELLPCARLEGAAGAVLDPFTAQLDGMRLVRAMRPVLESLGVTIYEHTPVLRIHEGATIELTTPCAKLATKAVVLATNAYTPRLGYFRSGIVPVHSHLLATEPLSRDKWDQLGWSHDVGGFSDDFDRISYASMTSRGELVFGGGSNAAYGYSFGNGTAYRGDGGQPLAAMQKTLRQYLPKASNVRVRCHWSGPVALTMNRVCTMGVRGKYRNVYYALGYSGHGITLSNLAGEVLTDIYEGNDARWRDLPFFDHRLLYIPPEPLRWIGYHAFTALTGRSPRRSM